MCEYRGEPTESDVERLATLITDAVWFAFRDECSSVVGELSDDAQTALERRRSVSAVLQLLDDAGLAFTEQAKVRHLLCGR